MLGERLVQDRYDSRCVERSADLNRQAPPRELVDQGQHPERLAVLAVILQKVIRPDMAGVVRADRHQVVAAAAAPARPRDGQPEFLPQAVDPFKVDGPALAPRSSFRGTGQDGGARVQGTRRR